MPIYTLYLKFTSSNNLKSFNSSRFSEILIDIANNNFNYPITQSKTNAVIYFKNIAIQYRIYDKNFFGIFLNTSFKDLYIIQLDSMSFEEFQSKFEKCKNETERSAFLLPFCYKPLWSN